MACFALLPRTRLYCSNCGENVGTLRITNLICSWKLGGCESAINSTAARRAHGSSARPKSTSSGDASHLRQGGARHARLNRVTRTVAKWFAQSTSEWPKTLPRGFKGPPIGAPPKPNEVGLVGRGGAAERLSFCPERQNEGCGACDDEARLSSISFFKQRKIWCREANALGVPTECVG